MSRFNRFTQGLAAFSAYANRKIVGYRSAVMILAGYASIACAAFLVHTVVGFLITGLLLLVLERSVDSGDEK